MKKKKLISSPPNFGWPLFLMLAAASINSLREEKREQQKGKWQWQLGVTTQASFSSQRYKKRKTGWKRRDWGTRHLTAASSPSPRPPGPMCHALGPSSPWLPHTGAPPSPWRTRPPASSSEAFLVLPEKKPTSRDGCCPPSPSGDISDRQALLKCTHSTHGWSPDKGWRQARRFANGS